MKGVLRIICNLLLLPHSPIVAPLSPKTVLFATLIVPVAFYHLHHDIMIIFMIAMLIIMIIINVIIIMIIMVWAVLK